MAFEVGKPQDVVGHRFTTRFARSENLLDWKIVGDQAVYSKEFYTACPTIRYLDGYYYMFHLVSRPGPEWQTYLVRSHDLVKWENSPCNPILSSSDEDKTIANDKLTLEEREYIKQSQNRNNSDFDLCEYHGKVLITYSWGNQTGKEFLAEAYYDGFLKDFLKGCFKESTNEINTNSICGAESLAQLTARLEKETQAATKLALFLSSARTTFLDIRTIPVTAQQRRSDAGRQMRQNQLLFAKTRLEFTERECRICRVSILFTTKPCDFGTPCDQILKPMATSFFCFKPILTRFSIRIIRWSSWHKRSTGSGSMWRLPTVTVLTWEHRRRLFA